MTNLHDQIAEFISVSTEDQFKNRFSAYKGEKKNFDYSLYKECNAEITYLAHQENRPVPLSILTARRLYKQSIAAMQQKMEEKSEPIEISCLRCMLINRGNIFISKSLMYSCALVAPQEAEYDEQHLDSNFLTVSSKIDAQYPNILAASTAYGNIKATPPILPNDPPKKQIIERRLHLPDNREFTITTHLCERSVAKEMADKTVKLNHKTQNLPAIQSHRIIYAPPGFGKTNLQIALAKRGIIILDTDDIPQVNNQTLELLLTTTSVLTNKLHLALNTNADVVAFVPATSKVLQQRNEGMQLTDEDAEYWWKQHLFKAKQNTVICKIEKSYLSQWFITDSKSIEQPPDQPFANSFYNAVEKQANSA